jgi:hypothetical protein
MLSLAIPRPAGNTGQSYDHPVNTTEISERLSLPRLGPYLAVTGTLDSALALYQWNATVSATLFELVGHAEIVLRNALDEQLIDLRRRSGDPSGEWFVTSTSWFHPWWTAPMITIIDRARQQGTTAFVVHQGKVVAELTFGFWRYLLTARYEASLWTPALRHAFRPGLARSTVYELVEQINAFRNRVAHHEPIHSRNIQDDIDRLAQLLEWISPPTAIWALESVQPRLTELLQSRP